MINRFYLINFILNQLGLIVVLIAGFLVYRGYFEFDRYFGITIGAVLFFILISLELFYKNFKRDMRKSKKQTRSKARAVRFR